MDALSELLKRIPLPGLKESNDRHIIAETITEVIGLSITAKQLSFKDSILVLTVPPVVKSAIYIRKQELQEKLVKKGIEIRDIR